MGKSSGDERGVAMKRNWELYELVEQFTLLPVEISLLGNKSGANRLGFALLLKFFQVEARFPRYPQEVSCYGLGVVLQT